jgi:hypothetical protein
MVCYSGFHGGSNAQRLMNTGKIVVQDALDTINKQLQASKDLTVQAERSAKAAESTAAISAQSVHVSQRAYVSLTPVLGRPLEVGKLTLLKVLIENNGRTPALGLSTTTCTTDAPPSTSIKDVQVLTLSGRVQQFTAAAVTLPPGKHFEQNETTGKPLTQDEFDDIRLRRKVLYLFSVATYKDIFGKLHHERICGRLDQNLAQLDSCRELNISD